MEALYIIGKNLKWRFQNPVTIMMSLTQPVVWLLLFTTLFSGGIPQYTQFAFPGIIAMLLLGSAGMSGMSVFAQKKSGSFWRLYISPVRRSAILLGHIGDSIVLTFAQTLIMLCIAFMLGVRIASGAAGFALMMLFITAGTFFISALSWSFSSLFEDENPFIAVVTTATLPLVFVSTALMPLDAMPNVFRLPVLLNPLTPLINTIRGFMLFPLSGTDWIQAGFTAALYAVLCGLAFAVAMKRLDKTS